MTQPNRTRLGVLWTVALTFTACSAPRPDTLGLLGGKLRACPESPNCVSSEADRQDEEHFIEPLLGSGNPETGWAKLHKTIGEMPRAQIIENNETYLHAEFTSRIFRFVDDLECYRQPGGLTVHWRSASRVGHSDMGANRSRVEELRAKLAGQ